MGEQQLSSSLELFDHSCLRDWTLEITVVNTGFRPVTITDVFGPPRVASQGLPHRHIPANQGLPHLLMDGETLMLFYAYPDIKTSDKVIVRGAVGRTLDVSFGQFVDQDRHLRRALPPCIPPAAKHVL
ncbi:MAG: hypothetical protein QOH12_3372 [Solirubrobacteraceae bacterium]|nr:hypothetical protein [Solirubrobacteraceae bacterium]